MKNLQELIDFLKAEKVKAQQAFKTGAVGSVQESYDFGKSHAFSLAVDKAELLLHSQQHNSEPSATIAANPLLCGAKPEPLPDECVHGWATNYYCAEADKCSMCSTGNGT